MNITVTLLTPINMHFILLKLMKITFILSEDDEHECYSTKAD